MAEDYYKILSVEPAASSKEIQQAADRLISNWSLKRGQSSERRSEILTQIRKASAVLTDPLQRFEYDKKHGFKRDFNEQSSMKKSHFIPLKYSESIETIDTVKIPGGLDYEKLERSIAAMETPELTEVNDLPDTKPPSKSTSEKNVSTEKVIDEISKNRPGSETDADNIKETDRFKVDSSNLKQHFIGADLKISAKESAMKRDAVFITESGRCKENSSDLKQDLTTEDLKKSAKESAKLLDADIITESGRYKNSSDLKQDSTTKDLEKSAKESAKLVDADIITESGRCKENSSNLKQDLTTEDMKTSGKESATLFDADNITESGRYKENSSDLKQDLTTEDLETSSKESATLLDSDNITKSGRYKENSSNLKQDLTTEDLETSSKESIMLLDADINKESGPFEGNASYPKQDYLTDDLKTHGKESAMQLDVDKAKEKKKTIKADWKDSISETDIISGPIESVTVTKRIAGTDVKTVYSFGPDIEFIEVFVNDGLRVKIFNGESHDMCCNDLKHHELPAGVIVGASTVIAANNCIITTEVTRRGKRESIAVYKNGTLLCRTGSAILEDLNIDKL